MDLKLTGKTAIIAGGSKGIGAASARMLASEGANIFLISRDQASLEEFTGQLREDSQCEVDFFAGDLTQEGTADKACEQANNKFGRIDILVNSAGASQGGVFWEIPDEIWSDSFDLKFMATIRMIRAAILYMRDQKYGRIVTIVGNAGRQPHPRTLPGAAANAALLAVTKGLADEVAEDGVIINAINPGPTKTARWNTMMDNLASSSGSTVEDVEAGFTENIPSGRLGEPEEIARMVAILSSDLAANMTGTSVTMDGGMTKAIA
ncbi:MAG: SDR family oxidoreductase [Rhodospirillales bacterium]|jgi:3-oxoacyl-[acyl-carrier protein] reductase